MYTPIESWIIFVVIFILAIIPIYIVYLLITKCYIKVSPNQLAIIYGRVFERKDTETGEKIIKGYRMIKGGATLIIPVLEAVEYLDLTVKTIAIELQNVKNQAGEYITVQAYIVAGFKDNYKAFTLVAEYFKEEKSEVIQTIIQKIASNQIKISLHTKLFNTIIDNQAIINEEIKVAIDQRVQKMGLEILDFSIQEIKKEQ